MTVKELPKNIEAEKAVLGTILLSPESINTIIGRLQLEDFFYPQNKLLFKTFIELNREDKPIDDLILLNELNRKKLLKDIGGGGYLNDIKQSVPSIQNLNHYIEEVKDKSVLRQLIGVSNDIRKNCFDSEKKSDELIELAEAEIFKISQGKFFKDYSSIGMIMPHTFEELESYANKKGITGVNSGYPDLDSITSGFQKSDLIILAARPGMGKTSFALNIASNAALKSGHSIGIFSLEMSNMQLVQRLLAGEAKINLKKLRNGQLSKKDWSAMSIHAGNLADSKIYIDDTPGITLLELRSKARRMKAKEDIDMIIIDYLQLMHLGYKVESRQIEIAEISRALKGLARQLNIPILALSQLSRQSEQRKTSDRKPKLSDLRESGAIEQDADMVIFVHRDYREGADAAENVQNAEIIIGKHRNGPMGVIELTFFKNYTRFESQVHYTVEPDEEIIEDSLEDEVY